MAQNRSSNESRVVTVELECTDAARPSACWRTQLVMSHADAWPVGTAGIPLIYDPEEPGRAMAVTRLECGVRLREQGQIMAGGGWLAAGLVAPLACITANVIAALSWAA